MVEGSIPRHCKILFYLNIVRTFLLKYNEDTITIRIVVIYIDHSMEFIWTCSMESMVDMPTFHMESSGIHVEQ